MVIKYLKKMKGGALVLLPLIQEVYAFSEISFSSEFTDNLYLLNKKEPGNVLDINLYVNKNFSFNLENEAVLYLINFDDSSSILENSLTVSKTFLFKNLGNKDKIYFNFYVFHTPYYEIYRNIQISTGNFFQIYLREKYLLSVNLEFFRKDFISHSLDEQKFFAKSLTSIPMPYFFLIPFFSLGIKNFIDKNFYFYETGVNLDFPLNFEHSFFILLKYEFFNFPNEIFSMDSIFRDPFFENNFIKEKFEGELKFKKVVNAGFGINFDFLFYKRKFAYYGRNDRGIKNSISLLKFLNKMFFLNIKIENTFNFSNIMDFEYKRNAFEVKAGLIF